MNIETMKLALAALEEVATKLYSEDNNNLVARAIPALRDALYEQAMQRFTDLQQEMEKGGGNLPPPLTAERLVRLKEMNERGTIRRGHVEEMLRALEAWHRSSDVNKMMAISQESRQVEPVVEFRGRRNTPEKTSECWGILLCDFMEDPPKGTKLYTAPPQRKPLTDEMLWKMWVDSPSDVLRFARAIEQAHGIGGEK